MNLQRHTGQFSSSSRFPSTKFSKHFLQNECRQCSVRGSSKVSKQIEHSSKFFRSCLVSDEGILLAEAISSESDLVVLVMSVKNPRDWLQTSDNQKLLGALQKRIQKDGSKAIEMNCGIGIA